MQIFVKTLTGKVYTIETAPNETFYQVKMYIEEQTGIPPDQQVLVIAGKIMQDGVQLCEIQAKEADVLIVIFKLRNAG